MKALLWFHTGLAVLLALNMMNGLLGLAGLGYTRTTPGEFGAVVVVFLITAGVAWGGWHFFNAGSTGTAQLILGAWWLALIGLVFWAAMGARWN